MPRPRFKTLAEWLQWQEGLHAKAIDLDLTRVQAVFTRLKRVRPAPAVITVAGTNGKGSSVALLEAIYSAGAYRVGTFTSPHLLAYNERIKLQGRPVSDAALCEAFAAIDAARGPISLTYFEFNTLAALYIFAQSDLDITLLEVGLGGRLDATNIIDADVALITSIDLDHQAWLGETRAQIAVEKAGIMRAGRPAICGDPAPPQSLLDYAAELKAELKLAERDFFYHIGSNAWDWQCPEADYPQLPPPALRGAHQYRNAAAVIMTTQQLQTVLPLTRQVLESGLRAVHLPGRFQRIREAPCVIVDVAHNPEAVEALCRQLRSMPPGGRCYGVFGMLNDKALVPVLLLLAEYIEHWFFVDLPPPRGCTALSLAEALQTVLSPSATCWECHDDIKAAYHAALMRADAKDTILVTGSFLTVSKVLALELPQRL